VTAALPPAGWYPDPSGAPMQRYFDGADWTEHRAPLAARAVDRRSRAQSRPSSATAVIASVLALLGGLFWMLPIIDALRWIADTRKYPVSGGSPRQWFNGAALALTVVLLLSGAILLLTRRRVGRLLIVIGCGVNIAMVVVQALSPASDAIADLEPLAFLFLPVPLVTIVLALAPSTRRWCKSSRQGLDIGGSGAAA
jgi:hypothetical protein